MAMTECYRAKVGTRIEGLATMGSEQEQFEGYFLDGTLLTVKEDENYVILSARSDYTDRIWEVWVSRESGETEMADLADGEPEVPAYGVNGPTGTATHTCTQCGREYDTTDADTSESGDAWGRPDLCHACAWQKAIDAGCTHSEPCRCAQ